MREAVKEDVGAYVRFIDPTGREHDALITGVWGPQCINLVYVLKDPKQEDVYGRKTNKQYTSIMHGSVQQAHGNYWLWAGEERSEMKVANPLTE